MKRLYTLAIATLLIYSGAYAQGWEPVGADRAGRNPLQTTRNIITWLCYDNGTLYAGAGGLYKWDGVSWERFGSSGDPAVVCVDKEHNLYASAMQDSTRSYVMKWDGAQWSELGTGSHALNLIKEINAVCADKDGNIYAAGSSNDTGGYFTVVKWDGTSWSQLGTGSNALNANGKIWTIAADSHGNIYAAGAFTRSGYVYVAKWDGTMWSKLGAGDNPIRIDPSESGLYAYIPSLYIDGTDNVYACAAAGRSYSFVTKWNGSLWIEMGNRYATNSYTVETPVFTNHIQAITGDKAGNIYIAGMGVLDATGRNSVMKWSGDGWVQVSTGRSALNANASVNAICVDASGLLYAGGEFTDNARKYEGYRYVARYNTLDTAQISEVKHVVAWPNPANDFLFVKGIEFNEYIYIYDISGAVKMKILNSIAASGATPAIDISALAPGSYFLRSRNCIPFFFNKK